MGLAAVDNENDAFWRGRLREAPSAKREEKSVRSAEREAAAAEAREFQRAIWHLAEIYERLETIELTAARHWHALQPTALEGTAGGLTFIDERAAAARARKRREAAPPSEGSAEEESH